MKQHYDEKDRERGSSVLEVEVRDYRDRLRDDARVILRPSGETAGASATRTLELDRSTSIYRVRGIAPGRYRLRAEAGDLEGQEREVEVHPAGSREVFVLGEPGMPSFQRGKVRVPFEPRPELLAVKLDPGAAERGEQELLSAAGELGLSEAEVPDEVRRDDTRLFSLPESADEDRSEAILRRLEARREVLFAGQVVVLRERSVSFLTAELVARFLAHVDEEAVRRIAERFGLEILRAIPYSPNTYHLRWRGAATYGLLGLLEELQSLDEVDWAEPNLVTTAELDAVTPTDYLWPGVWDRQLVGTPDAWQALQDQGLEPFGEPSVILATVDQGIQSSGGVPVNPDLGGTVSDGSDKVYRLFDFRTLVPNNDAPPGDHGMGVAGVATARANNGSVILGQQEGLAGAAPNCRVMGLIFPSTEVDQADMYIWAAGFDPNSPRVGFPAPISPAADVFSTSIGFGAGAPISGTASAMLDFLMTYGREGKGCLCFFSSGNANNNFTTSRPWAAYEKTFGMAASTLADDGTTEIRAPYSGFGPVEVCAPSHDQFPTLHNPPARYATWACSFQGSGNLIGHRAVETTLTLAAVAGATTIDVASSAGFSGGDRLLLDAPGNAGSEPAVVASVPNATQIQLNTGLLNAHAAGEPVATGAADYRNNFGGTSSATPLAAGVAALVLSANPGLTWIEARQILRDTAVKIDAANADPVGRWLDADGNPSTVSGLPPLYSQWYGYGRIDAAQAVQGAFDYTHDRDLVVRENLGDTGTVASTGAFWSSPDLWVRNASPAVEGPAALPANYTIAGPHQSPIAGQANWVYARVKNVGTAPSFDYYVRVYLTHFPGLEFTYPASFIPTTRPGDPLPTPLVPGTYLIGEQKLTDLAPGADTTVAVEWPAALIPPETVTVAAMTVTWHPCLLLEVAPHDGLAPTGNHVWDDNNLAQKNISIVYPDTDLDLSAIVVGNLASRARFLVLELDRTEVPPEVRLFVDPIDRRLTERLKEALEEPKAAYNFLLGEHRGRLVAFLADRGVTRLPVFAQPGTLTPIVLGAVVGWKAKKFRQGAYGVGVTQRNEAGAVTGAAQLEVRIGRRRFLRPEAR